MSKVNPESRDTVTATGLRGGKYAHRNHSGPTRDGTPLGRWIATDESGWNGEDLYRPDDPYFVVGSVAMDDMAAESIIGDLRLAAAIKRPSELKFQHFVSNARRLQVLAEVLGPGGPVADRAGIYLTDKRYFITAKIIDLLLEEYSHSRGIDLYAGDQARKIAWNFFEEGPRALGLESFDRLIYTFVEFARTRKNGQPGLSVEEFFNVLEKAFARSTRRRISDLLLSLLRTRAEADELYLERQGSNLIGPLEPLIPVISAVISSWSQKLGPVSILADEQAVLTDEILDTVEQNIRKGPVEFRHYWRGIRVSQLTRGNSIEHPSIQLADLVAGAGRAVAHRHERIPSQAAQAGTWLWQSVVPLIWREGMLPHDKPERFAEPKSITAVNRV